MQKLLPFILLAMVLQSCNLNFGVTRTTIGSNIDIGTRSEIRQLNDKFFGAVFANDTVSLRATLSGSFIETLGNYAGQVPYTCKEYFNTDTFSVLGEYKVDYTGFGQKDIVIPVDSGDNAYDLSLHGPAGEWYFSLLLPKARNNHCLLSIIYLKKDGVWKINGLSLGQYSLFGKTAPDYYRLAQESYGKSYLLDADNYMMLCNNCLRPSHSAFRYKLDGEMTNFYEKVRGEEKSKHPLPLLLENVPSKPKLFDIRLIAIKDVGYFPVLSYLSSIDMRDTIALKKENSLIRREIDSIFTGIDKDKKYVFYSANNEIPDRVNNPLRHNFVDTIEK